MRKNPIRWLALGLWCWFLLEVGAWVALGRLTDSKPTYWGQTSFQRQLAAQDLRGRAPGWTKARRELERAEQSVEIRHPFLGSVGANGSPRSRKSVTYWVSEELGDLDSACYSEETFVVGIAGGSVAANMVRVQSQFILERLTQSPKLAGQEIHLVSIANAGHKQPQAAIGLGFLQALGVRFDAVLALDGFNEVALYVGAAKDQHMLPAYPRQWVSRVGLSLGNQSWLAHLDLIQVARAERAAHMTKSPLRYSWIRQLLWHRSDQADLRRVDSLHAELGSLGGERIEGTGPLRTYADRAEQLGDLVGIWERSSRRMDQLCRGAGALYLNFIQPNQYDPGSKPLSDQELEQAFRPDSHLREYVVHGYPLLRERSRVMADEGMLMHDLSRIFEEETETRYIDTCCHLNQAGGRVLAEAMVEGLLAALPQ